MTGMRMVSSNSLLARGDAFISYVNQISFLDVASESGILIVNVLWLGEPTSENKGQVLQMPHGVYRILECSICKT